ncbi:hypothetical protein ACF073_40785 [Streptomyces sp. NPDC015171]|uniref:hypothetical protein n=1 Tax=Streptomyces sp. NPDC015171 TaxID=3364945 RepID=UPI0036FAC43A
MSDEPATAGQQPAEAAAPATDGHQGDPAPSLVRQTATQVGSGVRHAGASIRHRLLTAHQSDEEVRRRLVARQLAAYEEVRERAREEIEEVHTRITRLEQIGAEEGWTPEQRQEAKGLREERKRRTAALNDLARVPFVPIEPTADQLKAARRASSTRRFVALMALVGALGALLVVRPQLLLLVLPAAVAVLWWLGRRPPTLTQRPVPERLLARSELTAPAQALATAAGALGEEDLPTYALADATTSEEAIEALRRAVIREGGDVAEATDGRREPWGWSVRLRFASGSPDDLNKDDTYRDLVTLLRLRRNGLLIESDPADGSTCTVRMMLRDPFTPDLIGSVPYRAPGSTSITDRFDLGVGMDASPLLFTLAGLMLLMVGDSGSGKSGIALAMGEAVTSTTDAVLINLDPVGTGVGDLGPAITLDSCMDQARIGAVLDFLLKLCTARARLRQAYGWGNLWRVSAEHPAFCVFVDEWPQLSDKNKKKLIALLLLGRKDAVWVYGYSQFGTKEYLGEAIGPKLSGRILGACRRVDVTELLGAGAVAEGYRADLLEPATHTEVNDAGQIYAHNLPGLSRRPIRYQVREISPAYAARVGAERAAHGLPDVTHTLTEAGLIAEWRQLVASTTAAGSGGTGAIDPNLPHVLMTIAAAFNDAQDPDYLTLDQVHAYLRADDAARWGRWDDRDDRGRLRELGKALGRALRQEGVELSTEKITEVEGDPRGYYAAAVQDALQKVAASAA